MLDVQYKTNSPPWPRIGTRGTTIRGYLARINPRLRSNLTAEKEGRKIKFYSMKNKMKGPSQAKNNQKKKKDDLLIRGTSSVKTLFVTNKCMNCFIFFSFSFSFAFSFLFFLFIFSLGLSWFVLLFWFFLPRAGLVCLHSYSIASFLKPLPFGRNNGIVHACSLLSIFPSPSPSSPFHPRWTGSLSDGWKLSLSLPDPHSPARKTAFFAHK